MLDFDAGFERRLAADFPRELLELFFADFRVDFLAPAFFALDFLIAGPPRRRAVDFFAAPLRRDDFFAERFAPAERELDFLPRDFLARVAIFHTPRVCHEVEQLGHHNTPIGSRP